MTFKPHNNAGVGGAKPGAGRKKGVPNKATLARQAAIAASGITPLDVIIADMRHHFALYEAEAAKGAKADISLLSASLASAREAAKDAAPYVHPRLAAVQHMGKGGGPIEFTDVRNRLARLIDGEAAVGAESQSPSATH